MSTTNTVALIRSGRVQEIFKLRTAAEFQAVYKRGAKTASRSFVVFVLANGLNHSRVGLTTSRKLGAAHDRNRIRRRVREILRTSRSSLPPGIDIVVNPRLSVSSRVYADLRSELLSLLGVAL